MISVTVVGNVGRSAESRDAGNTTVTKFSVASSRKQKDGTQDTTWLQAKIFGRRGESLCQYITKGSRVALVGELRTFEARDGTTCLEVIVDQVELLGRPQHHDDRRRDDRDERQQDGPL